MATPVKEREPIVLAERYHLEDCPALDSEAVLVMADGSGIPAASRVERYEATRLAVPAKGQPERQVIITRCVQCGGQQVKEKG